MGSIGNPLNTSLVQAAQAAQVAAKDRDRRKAEETRSQRERDRLDLRRVEETLAAEAVTEVKKDGDADERPRDEPPPAEDVEVAADAEAADGDGDGDEAAPPEPPHIDLQA